jgi:lipopolysaccharide export system permease protein
VIAVFSFILGNYIIPPANETMNRFREVYIDNNRQSIPTELNIHRQIEPGVFIYMQQFTSSNVGTRFTLERFEGHILKEKLTAQNIRWDEESGKWILTTGGYEKFTIHTKNLKEATGKTRPSI